MLDDYHLIEARAVQDGMAFLLEHLPPQAHLVLASRADPSLPLGAAPRPGRPRRDPRRRPALHCRRGGGVPQRGMGLALTAQDVADLERRTEGWITAIQLAALSMQGRDDVAGFIAGFAGDDRYIVDYLAEEVLQRQPDRVRSFLLQTSILSRLNGALCEAVTGQDGGRAMLEAVDRGNLFLVPLDDRRRWYRYHHLFADVLQARLLDEQPGDVPDLHRRASDWYEQNGDRSEAIRHAMAGRTSREPRTWSSWRSPRLRRARQDATLRPLARGAARRGGSGPARAQHRVRRRDPGAGRGRGRRRRGCGMPNDGWTATNDHRHDGGRRRGRLSSPPGAIASTGPGRPRSSAMWPAPWPMPGGRWTSSTRTTTSGGERPPPCWGSRTGRAEIWTPRTVGTPRAWPVWSRAGHVADVIGRRDHSGGHPDRPGPPRRGHEPLRAGLAAGERARRPRAAGSGGHARRASASSGTSATSSRPRRSSCG